MRSWADALALGGALTAARPWRALVLGLGLAGAVVAARLPGRVEQALEASLLSRAADVPVVVGGNGAALDLVLGAVFYAPRPLPALSEADRRALVAATGVPLLPLHLGHRAAGRPLVGSSPDLFRRAELEVAEGRPFSTLGEAVVGAEVARAAGLRLGDGLRADPPSLYDVAGTFPLRLRVVGILAPSGGPEDGLLLTDVTTAWALDGLLHGHADVADDVDAGPALLLAAEPTPAALATFHAHGDPATWPLHALLVRTPGAAARDLVLGAAAVHGGLMAVVPGAVVREALAVVGDLEGALAVGGRVAAAALCLVVAALGAGVARERARVAGLLRALGASRRAIAAVLLVEVCVVGGVAAMGAVGAELAAGRALRRALEDVGVAVERPGSVSND